MSNDSLPNVPSVGRIELPPSAGHLYISEWSDNSIRLSAYQSDDPMHEANHVEFRDYHSPYKASAGGMINCLSNILRQAGVSFSVEQ